MGRRTWSGRLFSWIFVGVINLLFQHLLPLFFKLVGMAFDLLPQRFWLVPLSFALSMLLVENDRANEAFHFFSVDRFWIYIFPVGYSINYLAKKFTIKSEKWSSESWEQGSGSPGEKFYRSKRWQTVRYKFLKKTEKKCVLCGSVRGPFHVDHIKPRSKYPRLALDENNLQLLCAPCNLGKGVDDSGNTDFRRKRA